MGKDEEAIRMLPGDLRRVAEVAGLDAAVRISRAFRGTSVYVPGLDELERMARDATIRKDYDTGVTARKIAEKHRIAERHVRRILKAPGEAKLPEELLRLLAEGG